MDNKIKVLHTFDAYLLTTMNWLFNIINHLPDAEIYIASEQFVPCNFYSEKFKYLRFPLKRIETADGSLFIKAVNKVISIYLRLLYPRYLYNKSRSCDLVHSHLAPVGWVYSDLANKLGVPHIISFYGYDYESLPFKKPVWKSRYKKLFQNTDLFLCEGSNGARLLQKNGCPAEKIRVARLGVDTDHIPFWKRKKDSGELHLVQVASLTEKKGHRYTIEAFSAALTECPHMKLTLIGYDRDGIRERIMNQISRMQVADKVNYIESIDYDSLHKVLEQFHVFIHPSYHTASMDCEGGAPIVLLDAQATGMPVISTLHCDIPDEVLNKKTGILLPEKDGTAIAEAIKTFYFMGQEEYERFSNNASVHVREAYNSRINAGKIRSIYSEALNPL